jgi:hypothetical protein
MRCLDKKINEDLWIPVLCIFQNRRVPDKLPNACCMHPVVDAAETWRRRNWMQFGRLFARVFCITTADENKLSLWNHRHEYSYFHVGGMLMDISGRPPTCLTWMTHFAFLFVIFCSPVLFKFGLFSVLSFQPSLHIFIVMCFPPNM